MVTRLQRNVQSGSACFFTGLLQSHNFRVVAPGILVESVTDNRAILHDDATHGGIRAGEANAVARQIERVFHEMQIVIVHGIN